MNARENLSAELRVIRGATLAGTVTDPAGKPANGIRVYAFRMQPLGDTEFLIGPDLGKAVTDASGDYRIEHLLPGRYVVSAFREYGDFVLAPIQKVANGQAAVEGGAFSGGADNYDDAEKIELDLATERRGVDLRLAMTPVTTISGTVKDREGRPASGVQVRSRQSPGPFLRDATTAGDGSFELTRVTAGEHEIVACAPAGKTGFGRARVISDGRTPIRSTIELEAGATVTGRVSVGDALGPAQPSAPVSLFFASVHLSSHDDTPCVRPMAASPEFRYDGVPPGQYVIDVHIGDGWMKQSELVAGRDAFDFPFEVTSSDVRDVTITLTHAISDLSGVVTDDRGQPSTGHTVIVFAADDRYWTPRSRRILAGRPDQHGRYRFARLPAGDYIVALGPADLYGVPTASLLRDLRAHGTRVVLAEGARVTQDLRAPQPRF